jgi:hypothetical protein
MEYLFHSIQSPNADDSSTVYSDWLRFISARVTAHIDTWAEIEALGNLMSQLPPLKPADESYSCRPIAMCESIKSSTPSQNPKHNCK